MGLESWFVEHYAEDKLPLRDSFVQWILNTYLEIYHRMDRLSGRPSTMVPRPTEEIAERSRELMETHYDMPLSLFTSFLGPTMKYSMGLWERGADTLDDAQRAMMDDLCAKADIHGGQTLLDIGCGFGSFAEHMLREYPDTEVHGLTLSQTQADYIRDRQREEGHPLSSPNFHLIQGDFNDCTFDANFDRIVSIGVFEHISNLTNALKKIRQFIKDDGLCLLHYIVYRPPDGRMVFARQDPFLDKYIFPGSRIWSEAELFGHQEHFTIEKSWFFNGSNYRRTLESWLRNFKDNRVKIESEGTVNHRAVRIWDFYLRACIGTFRVIRGTYYGNAQYLLGPNH